VILMFLCAARSASVFSVVQIVFSQREQNEKTMIENNRLLVVFSKAKRLLSSL